MNRLSVRVLGAPEISWAGQSLRFRSRKELALLVYLVVEGGQHQREKLIALLWPESDRTLGGAALRNTLARLRRSLGEAAEFLVPDGSLVRFAVDRPLELDVRVVETVLSHLSSTDEFDPLHAALGLVRGEFLEGFSVPDAPEFDLWASVQREWWHRRIDTLFAELARRQLETGMYAQAVETALRWVRHAPLNEAAHRCLMEAYALAGERTAALRAYEACETLLAAELGVAPAPETSALAQRLRRDGRSGHDVRGVPPRARARRSAPHLPPELPLVGRAREHSLLVGAYWRAFAGETQTVCLWGEAGTGKTRLANAFLDWAGLEEPGPDVLRGRSFEVGGLPYEPLVDALRARIDRENAPDDLVSDTWLAELSQLLPELRDRYPDLPAPMGGDPDFVRARLFEAVAVLGMALAARQPVVLFVEDVQWADPGTRDLLRYLARRWSGAGTRALVLVTLRQEEALIQPDLREWLAGLERDVVLTRLELTPLTRADLRELVRAVDAATGEPGEGQAELGDWLLAETGGSPFFVVEMLQTLREQEGPAGERQAGGRFALDVAAAAQQIKSAGRLPVSPGVRGVILARLGRLSERARGLLLAGVVLGREYSFRRLCQVARLDEFDGLPALEELLVNRLLVETGDEGETLALAHENIRDVAYTEAGATRRRLYHRQALAVLEREGAPPAELAFHAAAARLTEPAFRYALAAGDVALSLHAFADAVAHYGSALELADQVATSSEDRCHLCANYGRALELSGRYVDALAHYEAVAGTAEQRGDRALALTALLAQGTIRATPTALSDFALAEALGQQSLALARDLEDRVAEAKIQWHLLNVYRMTNRNSEALAAGERALALAREHDLREQMAYAANDLVYAYTVAGDVARTLEMARTAIELWRELGNQPMLTDSLTSYANTLAMTGAYEAATEIAADGLRIARTLENRWAQSNSLISYALVYWRQMAVERLLAVTEESIRLGEATAFVGAQVFMRVIQAQVRLALGASDEARMLAQTAQALSARNMPLLYPAAAGTLTMVAQSEGNRDEAAEILATIAGEPAFDIFFHLLAPETAACRQALLEGDYEGANRLSGEALAFLEERRLRMFVPDFLHFQGQALIGLGRTGRAQEVLERAAEVLQATGSRWRLWEVAGLLGDLAERRGDQASAGRWWATARSTVRAIADQIGEPELRATFLGRALVRRLLAADDS